MADEKTRRGRPKGRRPALELVLTMRGTPAYKAWIKSLVTAKIDVSAFAEEAIRREAKRRKYELPPPRTHEPDA